MRRLWHWIAGSFKNRLLTLTVGLVLIGQGVTAVLALAYLQRSALTESAQQLDAARRVLDSLLAQRADRLRNEAALVVADTAFKETLAVADRATLQSALINHARRVDADAALLYDAGGTLIASGFANRANPVEIRPPEEDAAELPPTYQVWQDSAMQFVFAPVRAPTLIAWVALGFEFDQELAQTLRAQSGSDVSFVARSTSGATVAVATTLSASAIERMIAVLAAADENAGTQPRSLRDAEYFSLATRLPAQGGAVEMLAHHSVAEALQLFRQMRMSLLLISMLSVAAAALLAWFSARNLLRPLIGLVQAARRIGGGDYSQAVSVPAVQELGLLARSFNLMREDLGEREARILHQNSHDAMTGLLNRHGLSVRMDAASAGAQSATLLLTDVQRFRDINASVGHAVGDAVLCELARQLRALAGGEGAVARIGADQFAVYSALGAPQLLHRYMKLADELRAGLVVLDVPYSITLRAGLAGRTHADLSADDLLRRADVALMQAKESAASGVIYEPASDAERQRRILLVGELRSALGGTQLQLHYQPLVRMTDREPQAYEALLRWHHPRLGEISPAEFVPLAERAALMPQLSAHVLGMALAELGAWRRQGFTPRLSVNLSAHDLADGGLCNRVLGLLQTHQVAADQLKLEVTETAIMQDASFAAQVVNQLRLAGVRFSIDDFGTGHSSLAQLASLPVDELKIDRSFVHDVEVSPPRQAIVRTTAELAHSLGLTVVAEGVETTAAWAMLLRLGCDHGQGYLISRPMSAERVREWHERALRGTAEARAGLTTLRPVDEAAHQ